MEVLSYKRKKASACLSPF